MENKILVYRRSQCITISLYTANRSAIGVYCTRTIILYCNRSRAIYWRSITIYIIGVSPLLAFAVIIAPPLVSIHGTLIIITTTRWLIIALCVCVSICVCRQALLSSESRIHRAARNTTRYHTFDEDGWMDSIIIQYSYYIYRQLSEETSKQERRMLNNK